MSFIALQCFQCSTMQVKQRKKSSNKWTCVVCNQKQSMRHVFAQAPMAPDVRSFVQTFNMSRLYADQNREETHHPLPTEEPDLGERKKKKRTDWSEYVHYEPQIGDEIEDMDEPKIVTELPNSLFKKPKLSTYASRLGNENAGNGFKPVFSKRKFANTSTAQSKVLSKYQSNTVSKAPKWSDNTFQEKEPTTGNWNSIPRTYSAQEIESDGKLTTMPFHLHSKSAKVLSKWGNYMVQDKSEDLSGKEVPISILHAGKEKAASKWDKYVSTEEDDDTPQPRGLRDISNRARQQLDDDDGTFDVSLNDETVEEDIHPDFI